MNFDSLNTDFDKVLLFLFPDLDRAYIQDLFYIFIFLSLFQF